MSSVCCLFGSFLSKHLLSNINWAYFDSPSILWKLVSLKKAEVHTWHAQSLSAQKHYKPIHWGSDYFQIGKKQEASEVVELASSVPKIVENGKHNHRKDDKPSMLCPVNHTSHLCNFHKLCIGEFLQNKASVFAGYPIVVIGAVSGWVVVSNYENLILFALSCFVWKASSENVHKSNHRKCPWEQIVPSAKTNST